MPMVEQILASKGSDVVSISQDATVYDAAVLMNKHRIGALVVTNKRKVQGMFTERDILTRLVAKRRDAKEVKTGEVMTSHVVCCWPRTKVAEARKLMRNRRIRHLPVVDDDGKLPWAIRVLPIELSLVIAESRPTKASVSQRDKPVGTSWTYEPEDPIFQRNGKNSARRIHISSGQVLQVVFGNIN